MTREEAIEIINRNCTEGSPLREACKVFIPELEESEDERIRKGLLEALKTSKTVGELKFILPEPTREECVAYLEKQKKPHYTKRNALFSKCVENCDPEVMQRVSDEVDEMLQKEQKPAEWSEEDEDMLNSCISSIEEAKENRYAYKETDGDTSYDHEIAWLKSLRPVSKESLQPHWKPSEGQMKMLAMFSNLRCVSRQEAATLESLYNDLKKLM